MQTGIDMNGYKINSPFFITGYFNKSENSNRICLNGENPLQIIPYDCRLTKISCVFHETVSSIYQFTLILSVYGRGIQKHSFNSTQNNKKQTFTMNVRLSADDFWLIDIYKQGTKLEIDPNWGVFSFVFSQ